MSRIAKLGLTSAAVLVAAALLFVSREKAAPEAGTGRQHIVHIRGMTFQPATLHIAPGDSVTWINDDILLHAVKSTDPEPWQSKDLPPTKSWAKTFTHSARYLCPYHPPMVGEIVVGETSPSLRQNEQN